MKFIIVTIYAICNNETQIKDKFVCVSWPRPEGGGGCDTYVSLKSLFIAESKSGKRTFNGRIRILIYLKNQGFEYSTSSLLSSNSNFCMTARLRRTDKKRSQILDYDQLEDNSQTILSLRTYTK